MTTEAASDEEMRKLLIPACTIEQVEEVVRASFVRNGEKFKILRELDSYDDKNYMAEMDGTKYLVKVHNGFESKDFIDAYEKADRDYDACSSIIHFQTAIMKQLIDHGIATSNPQLCDGVPLAIHSLPVVSAQQSPCELVVKLMTWVPGRTLSSLKTLPIECLADAGRYLGKVDHALDAMDSSKYPAAQRFHEWDGKNTLQVRKFIHAIDDPKRKSMIESIISAFENKIISSGDCDKFRKGVNQSDFNDANVLVDNNFQISGVIDFGDSTESWRILDLSVGMAYALLTSYGKQGRSLAAAAAMLRGYNQIYPLQELELKHLHLLITCRLACSCTLGAFSLKQSPGNEYLLLHSKPAWDALELIWGHDETYRQSISSVLNNIFAKACSVPTGDGDVIDCSDISFPDPHHVDILSAIREVDISSAKRRKLGNSGDKPIITFVTGNKKKLEEVKRILGSDLPYEFTNQKVDLPELQGDTIEIAKEKCLEAARIVGGAVFTEDTSLCFTALNGLPGPYIKWFQESCGHDGLNKMIHAYEDKSAYAQTVIAFCPGPKKEVRIFDGRTMGKIVPARGKLEFGWDPIFEPDEGKGLTYAEMGKDEKDAISQRGRAMAQLKDFFTNEQEAIKLSLI